MAFGFPAYLLNQRRAQQCLPQFHKVLSPRVWYTKTEITLKQEVTILSIRCYTLEMKRSPTWKKQRKNTWNRKKELLLSSCLLPLQAPQFMNSWEISFSQEKDDFLVHIKVEMTKTDCINTEKRCFLKKGDRALPLFAKKKKKHQKTKEKQNNMHIASKKKKNTYIHIFQR